MSDARARTLLSRRPAARVLRSDPTTQQHKTHNHTTQHKTADKLKLSDYREFIEEGWMYLSGNDAAGNALITLHKRKSRLEESRGAASGAGRGEGEGRREAGCECGG